MAREEFGAVEAEGFDFEEDTVRARAGFGDVFEFEDVGAAGGVDYGRFHCGHVGVGGCGAGFGSEVVWLRRKVVSVVEDARGVDLQVMVQWHALHKEGNKL